MSEKDRDRLKSFIAASKAANAASGSKSDSSAPSAAAFMAETPTEVVIPPLSPRTAGAALRGFVPYGDDPHKQDRYRSYISSQTLNTTTPQPVLRKGTIEEINNELADFASSARIFRPMSYAMSSRFTSGSASLAVSDMQQAKPGLHVYDAEKAAAAIKEKGKPQENVQDNKPLTPREQAARDGKYGALTRVEKAFYPTKLVCRRFGVKDPHPDGEPKGIEVGASRGGGDMAGLDGLPLPKNDASWESAFIYQPGPSNPGSASGSATPLNDGTAEEDNTDVERIPKTLADVGMPGDANQGRDTLTYTKPSIDIFKAIFASDDEDEDEDEQDAATDALVARGANDDDVPASVLIERQNAKRAADRKRKLEQEREKAIMAEGPVDLATFKPVFQRRSKIDEVEGDDDAGRLAPDTDLKSGTLPGTDGDAAKKKKRKKDKRKGVLSFHVDEEDGDEWVEKKVKIRPSAAIAAPGAEVTGDAPEQPFLNGTGKGDTGRTELIPSQPSTHTAPAGRRSAADYM
jgi:G patch domain-containing protein 1